jgi:hypothetical protein
MRTFIIATTAAAALFCFSAFTQGRNQSSASLPDLSGLWGNPYLYGIELPLSGAGPVVNTARRRQTLDADGRPLTAANAPLVSDNTRLVGDYTNPILRPEAAEVVKKHAEMSLAGLGYPSPPQPVLAARGALHFHERCSAIVAAARQGHDPLR